jgi:nucleolar protein 56
LRKQVEERLAFYDTGIAPMKNADAMKAAMDKYGDLAKEGMLDISDDEEKPKVNLKVKAELTGVEEGEGEEGEKG